MAVAYKKEKASFHGVLHLMSSKDMKKLDNFEWDNFEWDYSRIAAKARLYNG